METMKVALFRSSLERRGDINVRSFILNANQLIGVNYETRSVRKRCMQNNSICLLYLPVKQALPERCEYSTGADALPTGRINFRVIAC